MAPREQQKRSVMNNTEEVGKTLRSVWTSTGTVESWTKADIAEVVRTAKQSEIQEKFNPTGPRLLLACCSSIYTLRRLFPVTLKVGHQNWSKYITVVIVLCMQQ